MPVRLLPQASAIDTGQPVNWGHPLNRDRVLWLYGLPTTSGGGKWFDLTGKTAGGTLTGSQEWRTVPSGSRGVRTPASIASYTLLDREYYAGPNTSYAITIRADDSSYNCFLFSQSRDQSANTYATGQYFVFNGSVHFSGDVGIRDNTTQRILIATDGAGDQSIYVDGVLKTTMASSSFYFDRISRSTSGTTLTIWDASDFTFWNRTLNADAAGLDYDLSRRNYPGVLNRVRPATWFVGGGGGTAYSLSCDAGAVVVAGAAAALKAGRKLACAAGAVVVAGADATLKLGRKLACAAGAVVVDGTAAVLRAARVLACAAGAVVVAGQDVTLTYSGAGSQTLSCESGTVTTAGQAAGLKAGRKLACDTATVTVAGQSAGLLVSRRAAGDTGTVTVAGQSAGLAVGRRLSCAAGSVTVAGQSAGLAAGRKLACAAGAVVVAGQDATLSYSGAGRVLSAGSGTVTVAGQTAALLVSRRLACEAGAVNVSGQDARLLAGRRLSAQTVAVNVAGADVSLTAARRLSCAAGAVVVAGSSATLNYSGLVVPPTHSGTWVAMRRTATWVAMRRTSTWTRRT